MRNLLLSILLFAATAASAQHADPRHIAEGREPFRADVTPYSTAAEADTAVSSPYVRPLEWTRSQHRDGALFTARFTQPFSWINRTVLLRIGYAPAAYRVKINGKEVGYAQNGSSAAEFNITRYTREGINSVELLAPAAAAGQQIENWTHTPDAPADCRVVTQPAVRVRDWYCTTRRAGDGYIADFSIIVKSDKLNEKEARISYEIPRTSVRGHFPVRLSRRGEDTLHFTMPLTADMLWSADRPRQDTLRLSTYYEGRQAEYLSFPVGFRLLESDAQGQLSVNGTPVKLTARKVAGTASAEELGRYKKEGINTLILRPGRIRDGFYADCDTTGLYVIPTAPIDTHASGDSRRKGANPSNAPAWKAAYTDRALATWHRSRRHPSVIAVALADEGSANGICLYESYLALKRLEPERPVIYLSAGGEWNSDVLTIEIK